MKALGRLKGESRESSSSDVPPDPIPSTSTSSLDSPIHCATECIICEQRAHGIHFGVASCRACAAFFRRTVVLKKDYPCRRFTKKCIISKEIRYLCRYCRFQKCIRAGMTPDNVVYPKDADFSSPVTKEKPGKTIKREPSDSPKPTDIKQQLKTEEASDIPSTSSASTASLGQPKISVECHSLAQQLIEIFKTFRPLEGRTDLTGIHQLAMATYSLKRPIEDNLEIVEELNFGEIGGYWTRVLVEVAQWMQYIDDFVHLEFQDKIKILRNSWCSIHRFLNVVESLEAFGEEVFTEKMLIIGKKGVSAIKSKFPKELPSWQTLQNNFVLTVETMIEVLAKPMFDMCATHMELAFLLGMTLWNLKGLEVSESTLEIAESFQARLAEEMHEYYTSNWKVSCYAPRLIQLMELLRDNENMQKQRGFMWSMLQMFDVLDMELGDHTLFDPLRC